MRSGLLVLASTLLLAACGKAPAARVEPLDLKVACFNVWGVPFASRELSARVERMPAAFRALGADVLCLQEVFLPAARERLVEGMGPSYAATAGVRGGLLILSRLPIVRSSFHPFPLTKGLPFQEWLAGKGVLEADLSTPLGEVRVVTAHLAAVFDDERPRAVQRRFLLDRLGREDDRPVILAADLNTTFVAVDGPTAAWKDFDAAGFVDSHPPRRLPDGTWVLPRPTRVGWPRVGRRGGWTPDHVLVRSGARVGVEVLGYDVLLDRPDTALSDHDLLRVTLRLTAR